MRINTIVRRVTLLSMLACLAIVPSCTAPARTDAPAAAKPKHDSSATDEGHVIKRAFEPFIDEAWVGNGISYSPYRDGQTPNGGPWPSKAEMREDLQLIAPHWHTLRMYGARGSAEKVLEIIREDKLPLKVMLGAWISPEARYGEDGQVVETFPDATRANRAESETAIRLANAYPDIVIAITVGNETQVFWSFHKVRTAVLLDYIRRVRGAVGVPVTTADDFTYWDKPESKAVADEVDFIVMHVYPMWCGQQLDNAMPFTKAQYDAVSNMHPGHMVVIGEAGWATQKHNQGEQARLIVGEAGEAQQMQYHDDFVAWTTENRIANFYFEAFDENWKGGEHPDEVEKHWGLFNADRTPKRAIRHSPRVPS